MAYRNWSYYPDWVIPPSCIDPVTCTAPYIGNPAGVSDCFSVWSVSDPHAAVPPSPRYLASYLFYDGVGYQTAVAYSDDLVHFTQPLAPAGVLFGPRTSWPAAPGEFDYGGAALIGFLMKDYNVTAPRVLARAAPSGRFWASYYAQPTRHAYEPPPGATGLASSQDGFSWTRETPVPILDTVAAHGAQPWEDAQVYAPFLVLSADGSTVSDYYNAKGTAEQSGLATLAAAALPGLAGNHSLWARSPANPVLPSGPPGAHDSRLASDPKVFWDASLDSGRGAWVMLYFGVGSTPATASASICIAFSRDAVAWTKATQPLYTAGGHPRGYDKEHAHKAWLNVDASGRKYLYYTGVGPQGRGILLLTSTPL